MVFCLFYNEIVKPRRPPKTEISESINKDVKEMTVDRPVTTGNGKCGATVNAAELFKGDLIATMGALYNDNPQALIRLFHWQISVAAS